MDFYVALSFTLLAGLITHSRAQDTNANAFDILVFAQELAVTTCLNYKTKDPTTRCDLPASTKGEWTIHGSWPTRFDHTSPAFCDQGANFNPAELAPIEHDLQKYWPSIFPGNLRSFWRHEWLKHGTCASQIRELNDELKYFSRTLSWLHRFPMSTILRDANIRPDSNSIRATDVFDAIFKALGTRPNIECVRDQQGNSYLNGIRTCYSKELHLVDCPGRTSLYPTRHYGNSNDFDKVLYIFNCGRRDDFIRFPSVVPATTAK